MNIFLQKSFKRYGIVLTMLLLLSAVSAEAGKGRKSGMHKKWMAKMDGIHSVSGGIRFVDIEELNDYFNANGLNEFEEYAPVISFSKQMIYKRLFSSGEFSFLIWNDNTSGGYKTDIGGFSFMANTGFNILKPDSPLRLYPMAGIGYGLMKIKRFESSNPFSQAITTENNNIKLMQHTFLINLGGGIDFKIDLPGRGKKDLIIGLHGGYIIDPLDQDKWWSYEGTEITGSPDVAMSGGYVKLTIGKKWNYADRYDKRRKK